MTTIAFDGKKLCSDSMITLGNRIDSLKSKKIFKLKSSSKYKAIGISGEIRKTKELINWFNSEMNAEDYPGIEGQVLAITKRNKSHIYYNDLPCDKSNEKISSVGSGSIYAISAMKSGLCSKKAVGVAKSMDIFSGGKTVSIDLR